MCTRHRRIALRRPSTMYGEPAWLVDHDKAFVDVDEVDARSVAQRTSRVGVGWPRLARRTHPPLVPKHGRSPRVPDGPFASARESP
jgi:hypothetical protein